MTSSLQPLSAGQRRTLTVLCEAEAPITVAEARVRINAGQPRPLVTEQVYRRLLALERRRLVHRVPAPAGRRGTRWMPRPAAHVQHGSGDPTRFIATPSDAMDMAQALLDGAPAQELFASAAVVPLAGLLFAGSVAGQGSGIDWVGQALVNTEAATGVAGWAQAQQLCLAAVAHSPGVRLLAAALDRVESWEPRQREAICAAMHRAIAPLVSSIGEPR